MAINIGKKTESSERFCGKKSKINLGYSKKVDKML